MIAMCPYCNQPMIEHLQVAQIGPMQIVSCESAPLDAFQAVSDPAEP